MINNLKKDLIVGMIKRKFSKISEKALTAYEKEKLEEIDDKLLKHKLMNPTTKNLNQDQHY